MLNTIESFIIHIPASFITWRSFLILSQLLVKLPLILKIEFFFPLSLIPPLFVTFPHLYEQIMSILLLQQPFLFQTLINLFLFSSIRISTISIFRFLSNKQYRHNKINILYNNSNPSSKRIIKKIILYYNYLSIIISFVTIFKWINYKRAKQINSNKIKKEYNLPKNNPLDPALENYKKVFLYLLSLVSLTST